MTAPGASHWEEAPICEAGGGGMIFPLGGEFERNFHWGFRGFLYAVAMVYWFYGIAIIADIFMSSIEKVTSRRRRRFLDGGRGGFRTERVWNETVATLTLMALGSSAPEIFLSIIDTIKKRFHFGTLGPSTIVGSAAFNLLVIIAVCIAVIPSTEVRRISNLPAFYITAFFSILAYLWMAFMILGASPHIVDLWEALVTLLLLPVLVFVSWKVDIGAADGILHRFGMMSRAESERSDDNEEDVITFSAQDLRIEGQKEALELEIPVYRRCQDAEASGSSSCLYKTEALKATEDHDFEPVEGTLEFEEGELRKCIKVTLPATDWRSIEKDFLLILEEPEGAKLDESEDGGGDQTILTVFLGAHGEGPSGFVGAVERAFGLGNLQKGLAEWKEQFRSICFVGGSEGEQAEASAKDWALHVISLPWTVLFAFCPPPNFLGGWACFCGSLLGIAFLTACVSDLAELFGCVLAVPDIITAITFVALGTSMPDLFASISAAQDDPTADASIVNVTGSNSVNVFLGLGVPWTLAALAWQMSGRTPEWEARYPVIASRISGAAFVVEAGQLAFGVLTFCIVCSSALILLYLRRRWLGAELGGPAVPKVATSCAFLMLWLGWVAMVSGQVLRWSKSGAAFGEVIGFYIFALIFMAACTAAPAVLIWRASLELNGSGVTSFSESAAAQKYTSSEGNAAPANKIGKGIDCSSLPLSSAAAAATPTSAATGGKFDFVGVSPLNGGRPSAAQGSFLGRMCPMFRTVIG
mmetsp:Transcript_1165/g.2497  ORF Transcript_1165/g.2497 Transcript_1165/m.2497 type:complete len:755 (-) Transcript_1165:484-2748(-)